MSSNRQVINLRVASIVVACGAAGACGGTTVEALSSANHLAVCEITRSECTGYVFDSINNALCPSQNLVQMPAFQATVCFNEAQGATPAEAAFAGCDRYCRELYGLSNENCTARVVSFGQSEPGMCRLTTSASGGATARADCTRGGRLCRATATQNGKTICANQAILTAAEDASRCFDPNKETADIVCKNEFMSTGPAGGTFEMPRVNVADVTLESSMCLPPPAPVASIVYGVAAGAVGALTIAGANTPLAATGGSIVVRGGCDGNGELCLVPELRSMRVTFADLVVQGVTLRNIDGQLVAPAPIVVTNGVRTIPRASFQFEIFGTQPLGTSRLQVTPTQDVAIQLNAQSFSFSAQFAALVSTPDQGLVSVSVNISLPASTANPGAGCGGFSVLQSLLGFETLGWTSPQASLSLSPTLHTQGCYGLNVAGSGYMVANSARFATPLPAVSPHLALDVFVPTGQPNPYWLGAVQLYASCPSAGMNNAYLGQVELTGKPTGAFSTLTYALDAGVRSTLSQAHTDCFFSVAVNVNATPSPVVLDNLRFVP